MRLGASDLMKLLRSGSVGRPHGKGVFPGFPYIYSHKSSWAGNRLKESIGSSTRPGLGGR